MSLVNQLRDPALLARLWLAMAVARLGLITIGSVLEVDPSDDETDRPDLRPLLELTGPRRPRRTRLFHLGWLWLLVQLRQHQPLPVPRRLFPEPWPAIPERLEPALMHRKALCCASM